MKLIQEAIEAAETQDLCGNHNSADLLRRLVRELEAERRLADTLVVCLRDAMSVSYEWQPALAALEAHAKRREAGA